METFYPQKHSACRNVFFTFRFHNRGAKVYHFFEKQYIFHLNKLK